MEFQAVYRLVSHLTPYMNAHDHGYPSQRYRFLLDVRDNLSWLRDIVCQVELGEMKYESLGGMDIYFNTQKIKPMEPLVSLINDAEADFLWRERIVFIAGRLDKLIDDCISLNGRSIEDASEFISNLQGLAPRLRALAG